jgi:hypothetical protein
MAPIAQIAEEARKARKPVASDNPFLKIQQAMSRNIVAALDGWRKATENIAESAFISFYGSPILQTMLGIQSGTRRSSQKPDKNLLHRELLAKRIAELKSRIAAGGLQAATIRALLYAGMGRKAVDERGFEAVRRIRQAHGDLSLSAFKALVREQFNILLVDSDAALAAIPSMLPPDAEARKVAFGLIRTVLTARGEISGEDRKRLEDVARLFELDSKALPTPIPATQQRTDFAA